MSRLTTSATGSNENIRPPKRPKAVDDDQAVARFVAAMKGAIGYVLVLARRERESKLPSR
jgi:hypothetical protein